MAKSKKNQNKPKLNLTGCGIANATRLGWRNGLGPATRVPAQSVEQCS
jgi:hypothetical protein